ncbi:MAG TPA: methyl-accepting chemotaxis protein [Spirochaetota bacterium]|nr:methyl-accepting chemotaxis protein [Spirochaetota bacterium]
MQLSGEARRAGSRFTLYFLLSTEFFSYFVIIPMLFLYFYVNLDISMENLKLLLAILVVVVPVSMATTFLSDAVVLGPVRKYMKIALSGAAVPEDIFEKGRRRFFSLTFIHTIGSLLRWIAGLLMAYIPFTVMAELSRVQTINVWLTMAIVPPLGMVLYFFLTEKFVQRYLNLGFFSARVAGVEAIHVNFLLRMVLSICVMLTLPVIAVIGYFLLILERAGVTGGLDMVKLGFILVFGVIAAGSLVYGLTSSIKEKVNMITAYLHDIGRGDFTSDRSVMAVVDDLTMISRDVYHMKESLADIIREIRSKSTQLERSTNEISGITGSFTVDTQNQASTVEEITATLEEVSAGMDNIAYNAQVQVSELDALMDKMNVLTEAAGDINRRTSGARALTEDISGQAASGEEALTRMKESMGRIDESSRQMTSIIGIINDISDKINLLSLNAAIEAARAGDAGRGFAVVADEISKLADSTATSVKQIGSLIASSEKEIEFGLGTVNDVVEKISTITRGVGEINTMMESISVFMDRHIESNIRLNSDVNGVLKKSGEIENAIVEQKTAMNEVVSSVNGINELTQKISTGSEDIARNTKDNLDLTNTLKARVESFVIE